jgi:hypothetical protein
MEGHKKNTYFLLVNLAFLLCELQNYPYKK